MSVYKGHIFKNHNLELYNSSDQLESKLLETNQALATYLTSGYWNESAG